MWNGNYHPDVIVETFVRFHPGRSFTLQELLDYDAELFAANDAFFTAALQGARSDQPEACTTNRSCCRLPACRRATSMRP